MSRLHLRSAPVLLVACLACLACQATTASGRAPIALAIHGGAGTIVRTELTPELEASYRATLEQALEVGHAILSDGGASIDAVVAAVVVLEDSPLFNASRGAVFTEAGTVELDASIMDGSDHAAGAITGVATVKNPILLALEVMRASEHVMMSGAGADAFARARGLELVPNEYFYTDRRRRELSERLAGVHGTVGAVALDRHGHLAAATSTGGMTAKRYGRVGDSPIIGAGTYADDATCAVSSTGWGEYFIRGVVAHDISAMMAYGRLSLDQAARRVIHDKLTVAGGTGGVIAVDKRGNVAAPFNTLGMYRAWIAADGTRRVEIYGD